MLMLLWESIEVLKFTVIDLVFQPIVAKWTSSSKRALLNVFLWTFASIAPQGVSRCKYQAERLKGEKRTKKKVHPRQ